MTEYTLSIIKPDAVKRNLIGKINSIFEDNSLKIVAQKMMLLSKRDAEIFYQIHKERSFFEDLCDYMTSGPVVVQVLKGKSAVKKNRDLMGATNPENADENTIRKLYGISVEQNSVHGSDSNSNAKIEIDFFFSDREILD
ncbi:MAG: nucleoside-diphosphate kinase [Rickettsiales bacterium]|nr:nucleoside-diphosphate kinase [Rickettsiales bacterium]